MSDLFVLFVMVGLIAFVALVAFFTYKFTRQGTLDDDDAVFHNTVFLKLQAIYGPVLPADLQAEVDKFLNR